MGKVFDFFLWIKAVFNPPFQLILVDTSFEEETTKIFYIFKRFHSHECFKLSFDEIVSNMSILRSIHPITLMNIKINEYEAQIKKEKFYITETLRGNEFTLVNSYSKETRSGDFICNNLDKYNNFDIKDLCNIAHETGFKKGREISQIEAKLPIKNMHDSNNIVSLSKFKER